jgi:hypothetical protein
MVAPIYPFRLGQTGRVVQQIKSLFVRASKSGHKDELVRALREISISLQSDPLSFGDPWFNTLQDGGTVLHRVTSHLVVRYVVFRKEKAVTLLELLSHGSYWDSPSE